MSVTEGLLLYAEGKPEEGKLSLRTAAAANTPEALRPFVVAVNTIGDIPGTAQYMRPVLDAARLLAESRGQLSPTFAGQPQSSSSRIRPAATTVGESELLGGMVSPLENGTSERCAASGIAGLCVRAGEGPLVVTDLYSTGMCSDRILALVSELHGDLGSPRWAVTLRASQAPLTGARLVVRRNEFLFLGAQVGASSNANRQCAVTWAGYRPAGTYPPAESESPATDVASTTRVEPAPLVAVATTEAVKAATPQAHGPLPMRPVDAIGNESRDLRPAAPLPQPIERAGTPQVGAVALRRFSLALTNAFSTLSGAPVTSRSSFLTPGLSVDVRLSPNESSTQFITGYSASLTVLATSQDFFQTATLGFRWEPSESRLRLTLSAGAALGMVYSAAYKRLTQLGVVVHPSADVLFADRRYGLRLGFSYASLTPGATGGLTYTATTAGFFAGF